MATGVTDTASTGVAGSATGNGLIPEVWAHTTRDSLLANLVLANLVDRSFESDVAGQPADTIHVDGVGGTTDDTRTGFDVTSNITLGAGGSLNSEVITFLTQVDISINTHAYKYWDLEFELDLMTQMPLMQRGADRTSYVVAQKVDDDLAGEPDGVSSSVGTLAEPLTDDNILRSVQYLNDGNAQEENRYGYVSAAQQIEFLKIEKYINSLYQTALPTPTDGNFRGFFGSLYGVNWYMSTNVEGTNAAGHDNAMFQKEAIALVMIDNQRIATDYEISTDSFRHAVHSIYGIKLIRDTGSIVWLKGA